MQQFDQDRPESEGNAENQDDQSGCNIVALLLLLCALWAALMALTM